MIRRKTILEILGRILAPMFYEKKYISGRWFVRGGAGWSWLVKGIWFQKMLGFNRTLPWPASPFIRISNWRNLEFHVDDLNNFQSFGCYFQNQEAKICIGYGSYIAPNVGIITQNHNAMRPEHHDVAKDVCLGDACWIGMNSVILPGVILGAHTVVGAGSVVTRSFTEGHSVIAGCPARRIREVNPEAEPTAPTR